MSGTPRTYAGADSAAGPLLTVSHAHRAVLGEWVRIAAPGQPARRGQVIDVSRGALPALGLVSLPALLGLFAGGFSGIFGLLPAIWEVVYLFLAVPAAYTQISGLRFRR